MASPHYRCLRGTFVVHGYAPDGDSLRFVADDPRGYRWLAREHLLRLSTDGSTQLRLEGIDAPELHYDGHKQPLAELARDALLAWAGFEDVQITAGYVLGGERLCVRGAILSAGVDTRGRPIAYVLHENDAERLRVDQWHAIDAAMLRKTANAAMLQEGAAYLLLYDSVPIEHRIALRAIAQEATAAKKGVWSKDRTPSFALEGLRSISEHGTLIYPKLFRRCVKYCEALAAGFRGSLVAWLHSEPSEDDRVVIGRRVTRWSALLQVGERRVAVRVPLARWVFVAG